MLQTSRRQREEQSQQALSDRVTGLNNRLRLETDIETMLQIPGDRRVLLLYDLDGLHTYNDRYGYAAGDDLLRRSAQTLVQAAARLGGTTYRLEDGRLALLVRAGDRHPGEIAIAATAALHDEGRDLPIGRAYGEVAIPDEATDPDSAMQIAGQ